MLSRQESYKRKERIVNIVIPYLLPQLHSQAPIDTPVRPGRHTSLDSGSISPFVLNHLLPFRPAWSYMILDRSVLSTVTAGYTLQFSSTPPFQPPPLSLFRDPSNNLKDTYFHISIFHGHRRFLKFVVGQSHCQFTTLPFGLPAVPHVFTKCMVVLAAFLRL